MFARRNLVGLCALLVLPAAGGCTRTSDGSYVPIYQFATTTTPYLDVMTIEPTAPEADPRIAYFPPPPPPPRLAAELASSPAPRRTARSPRATTPPPEQRVFQCETEVPMQGRVRMDCR